MTTDEKEVWLQAFVHAPAGKGRTEFARFAMKEYQVMFSSGPVREGKTVVDFPDGGKATVYWDDKELILIDKDLDTVCFSDRSDLEIIHRLVGELLNV